MRRKDAAALMVAVIIGSIFTGCGSTDKNIGQDNIGYTKETQTVTNAVVGKETKAADNTVSKADKETVSVTKETDGEAADETDNVSSEAADTSESQADSESVEAGGYNDNSWEDSWGSDSSGSQNDYADNNEQTGNDEESLDNGGESGDTAGGDVNINDDNSLYAAARVNTVTYMEYAKEVLRLVNIERANVGAEPLVLDEALCNAANMRAIEMDYSGVFSHTRPDGESCFEVYDVCDVQWSRACAENIAAGYVTPAEAVDGWMHSDGHRANILNPIHTKMGLGYSTGGGGKYRHYWAQEFAG